MDWSDEEMEQLQNLSVHYSGVTTLYDELSINANQYSLSREFDYYYEKSLKEYSSVEDICSTSWATSIIDVANAVTGLKFSV